MPRKLDETNKKQKYDGLMMLIIYLIVSYAMTFSNIIIEVPF